MTGKTITALEIIHNKGGKWLVMVPKSIIRTGWYQDHLDFYPDMKVLPISNNFKTPELKAINEKWGNPLGIYGNRRINEETLRKQLIIHADVLIINPESFKKYLKEYYDIGVHGLFIDESTRIKNPEANITRLVTEFADDMKYVYPMTGLPDPLSKLDYYSQIRVIDPAIFGKSYFAFRGKYFTSGGYMNKKWAFNKTKMEEFATLVDSISIYENKNDCLDLPDRTDIIRAVELPPSELAIYKTMMRDRVLQLSGGSVSAKAQNSLNMKLRQLTAGFIINTDTEEVHYVGIESKLKELKYVLEELGSQPVIIWANFKEEIRTIKRFLGDKAVTAYSGTKNVDESVRMFMEGEAQYIIAHPATLKYGVTFTGNRMKHNCSYAVYFSMSYNFEDYYQSRDRIYRKGQYEKVTYIHLLTEKTIDFGIYKAVLNKQQASELFEEIVKQFSE